MKVMAIDLGDARTGVAVSDALGMLTGSTSVIESWNKEKTAKLVAEAYRKSGAQRLVMGGGRRSRPIRFCLITITTAKNARKPSTRLLRPLF